MTIFFKPSKEGLTGHDAFQVDDWVSKADYGKHKAPTAGRRAAAYFANPIHPLVAGKKGRKAGAFGSAVGHTVGGGAAGGIAEGALRAATKGKVKLGGLGSTVGGFAGLQHSVTSNTRKGRYKPQKKS